VGRASPRRLGSRDGQSVAGWGRLFNSSKGMAKSAIIYIAFLALLNSEVERLFAREHRLSGTDHE
jgi:hypothetical protein